MRKNLAHEIVHRNTIALQLNRIMLEKAEEDLLQAEELIGRVRLTVRQCGYSAAHRYAMKEPWSHRGQSFPSFLELLSQQYHLDTYISSSESVLDVVLD